MNDVPKTHRGHPLVRTRHFWRVFGVSWHGNLVKRDGKVIHCGHRHRTEAVARKCALRMRKARPGRCQDYRASEVVVAVYRRRDLAAGLPR